MKETQRSGLLSNFKRHTLVFACVLVVLCFLLGNDYYNAKAFNKKVKQTFPKQTRTIDYNEALIASSMKKRGILGTVLRATSKEFIATDNILVGADTCPGTTIGALPYNDAGTTVGLTDNYNLPADTTPPTTTGCPTCTAAGTPSGRGFIYTGTGTGPDAAYTVTFTSAGNTLNTTMTPQAGYDACLIVYTSTCSNLLSDAIAVSDAGIAGQAETVTISTMPAGTYNIVVDGYTTGAPTSGTYTLAVTGSGTIGSPAPVNAPNDKDGDGKSDFVVARGDASQITWLNLDNATGNASGFAWGIGTDRTLMEDYDGDLKDDIAVWRPGAQGVFYILKSSNNTLITDNFGQTGDDARLAGDWDGDGKADPAVYRDGTPGSPASFFYYRGSLAPGTITFIPFGVDGDIGFSLDLDGDGKLDPAVQRNGGGGVGDIYVQKSMTSTVEYVRLGLSSDFVVPGDYDGDGKDDLAVSRNINFGLGDGTLKYFFIRESDGGGNPNTPRAWGIPGDIIVQGDYDGDGKTDLAVWRPAVSGPSFWYVQNSTNGALRSVPWGQNGDIVPSNWNVH